MGSLADELREVTARQTLEMSAAERVALALRLGDDDLEIFCAATDLDAVTARHELRRRRQIGRVPSRVMGLST